MVPASYTNLILLLQPIQVFWEFKFIYLKIKFKKIKKKL